MLTKIIFKYLEQIKLINATDLLSLRDYLGLLYLR